MSEASATGAGLLGRWPSTPRCASAPTGSRRVWGPYRSAVSPDRTRRAVPAGRRAAAPRSPGAGCRTSAGKDGPSSSGSSSRCTASTGISRGGCGRSPWCPANSRQMSTTSRCRIASRPAVSQYSPCATPDLTRSPTARATTSCGTMSIRVPGEPGSTGTWPLTIPPSARVRPCTRAIRPVDESPMTRDGRRMTPGTSADRTASSAAVLEARYAAAPGKRSCSSGASGFATKAVLM